MTSLPGLFLIVRHQGAGHSWRTQGGDGSQGSQVPGGTAGRTWLWYSYHKTAAATWRVFCGLFCLLFPLASYLVLCLQVHSGVILLYSLLFQLVFFKCLPHVRHSSRSTLHDMSALHMYKDIINKNNILSSFAPAPHGKVERRHTRCTTVWFSCFSFLLFFFLLFFFSSFFLFLFQFVMGMPCLSYPVW